MKKIIYLLFSTLLFTGTAYAEEKVAVIVNSANTQSLSMLDIKNIYSDIVTTWKNGKTISVYNLPLNLPARENFSEAVLKMSASSAEMELNNLITTNRMKNPQKEKREKLVVSIVARNPDAIGYVPSSMVDNKTGIRVLFELD
jgi:ABC-type phosphate transport system substrate-binding protein